MNEVTLKEYVERVVGEHETRNLERIRALERQVAGLESLIDAKQRALALAVEKQEAAYNARFANVNEFRASLNDAVNRSVSREYVDARFSEIDRRLSTFEQWQARTNGQFAAWGIALTVLATIIAIIARFIDLGGG